ncbi:hypothetical protein GGR57DRAFT_326194 [Xylariaceae sp. FL1272]|nr:hypothetical protein GGR57DRAFT_326194 [Xylariaceae sp. FL1272]
MLASLSISALLALISSAHGRIHRHVPGHNNVARDASSAPASSASVTEVVVTSSTCSWTPFTTTIQPMTTVYAVLAESLNPAAAVLDTTFKVDDVVIMVVATGVQNIGTCAVTAPSIIRTAQVQSGMNPVDCRYVTSTVTQTIAPPAGGATVVVTEIRTQPGASQTVTATQVIYSVSQQTVTLGAGSSSVSSPATSSETTPSSSTHPTSSSTTITTSTLVSSKTTSSAEFTGAARRTDYIHLDRAAISNARLHQRVGLRSETAI